MVVELFLPRRCAGCQAPGAVLCPSCRRELARVSPRTEPGMPVWALGPYSEVRQSVIVAMKERRDFAARTAVGAVFRAGLERLVALGELPEDVVVVPAPTRRRAARLRGGDPMRAVGAASGFPVRSLLVHGAGVRDSVGLSPVQRKENMARGVRLVAPVPLGRSLVLIDDVVTTGATLWSAAARLLAAGATVAGALTFAAA